MRTPESLREDFPLPRFYLVLAFFLSGLCAWIYYPRWWFILVGILLGIRQLRKWWLQKLVRDWNRALEQRILAFFERLMNYLDAGYNPPDSWERAALALGGQSKANKALFQSPLDKRSQEEFYGRVHGVIQSYREGDSFEEALQAFGQDLSLPLLDNFIHHFVLGIHQGGDLAQLTESFYRLLFDRRELARDRETKLYAAKRELAILFAMPFILLAALRASAMGQGGRGLMDLLIHAFCLALFYGAWLWAQAILHRSDSGGNKRPL